MRTRNIKLLVLTIPLQPSTVTNLSVKQDDVVVVVIRTLTPIIKSVVTGQAPVTLGLRNTPGKNTNTQRWYAHISQLTQFMPPPETYKSEIEGRATMCQAHTGACVSLAAPGKTDYIDCHPGKTATYRLHVVPITTHTHDRRKSINETKQRKEKKRKKRKEMTRSEKNENGKERRASQEKEEKTRQKRGRKERKKWKNVILAGPRNRLKTALGS